jgi:uncharacterized OB-fold protein
MNEGWICPKCGHVYAPSVPDCSRCPAPTMTIGLRMDDVCTCGTTMICPIHQQRHMTPYGGDRSSAEAD